MHGYTKASVGLQPYTITMRYKLYPKKLRKKFEAYMKRKIASVNDDFQLFGTAHCIVLSLSLICLSFRCWAL